MTSRPPIDLVALRAAVGDRWPRVDVVAQTASTNADLLADHQAPDRTALAAEEQSAGRGRLDRQWSSPPGAGLTFSALFRPTAPILRWGWLPLLAGVALHEAVTATAGIDVVLKWPNDLLAADGRKLAGVLVQTAEDVLVVGIGLNVSTTADELPVPTATSLALCGATDVDRTGLLAAVLTRLDARYAQWADVDGDADACGLAAAYRERCATLGQDVAVTVTDGVIRGRAVDIDPTGRLVVDTAAGQRVLGAGDVEHLRAAE